MDIAERQNDEEALRLLAAARRFYLDAKLIHAGRITGTVILAAIAPVILWLRPEVGPALGALGGMWVFVARLLLQGLEDRRISRGVLAQEEFDTRVFALPWNRTLGRKLPREDIISSATRLKNRSKLRDWYPDSGEADRVRALLICQRTNAVWGRRLHTIYAWVVGTATAIWFGVGLVVAIIEEATLAAYLVSVGLPSLPAFLDATDLVRAHIRASQARLNIEQATDDLLEQTHPSAEACRGIQDQIFRLRQTSLQVPEWLYRLLRGRYESEAVQAAKDLATLRVRGGG